MEFHYPGDDILYFLMPLLGNPNLKVVLIMGKLSGKVKEKRWIPFIYHWAMIQENQPNSCVWNATILVIICCSFFRHF
jgi:hypothetical protein